MGFYYLSVLSIAPLGVAYGVLALIYWAIARATRGEPKRRPILAAVGVIFLVLPISEELWIAWNFGQACKEAGTFVHKKVQVDGFYDDTMGWGPRQLAESKYQFVESRDIVHRTLMRVERAGADAKAKVMAWYASQNPGKALPDAVVYPLDGGEQLVVLANAPDAWRVSKIVRPTARYHFRNTDPMNGTPVAYKIVRSNGSVVVDDETKQEIARYTSVARRPPWYFISLNTPGFGCDSPGDWPRTRRTSLIYREVLIPAQQK